MPADDCHYDECCNKKENFPIIVQKIIKDEIIIGIVPPHVEGANRRTNPIMANHIPLIKIVVNKTGAFKDQKIKKVIKTAVQPTTDHILLIT